MCRRFLQQSHVLHEELHPGYSAEQCGLGRTVDDHDLDSQDYDHEYDFSEEYHDDYENFCSEDLYDSYDESCQDQSVKDQGRTGQ